MKSIILILTSAILACSDGYSQKQAIKLNQCINAALKNKADIQAVRTDKVIAGLQTSAVYAKYLPQVSLAYDYRYNIVIPSQIVPVGLFYPVPTDATQAIKFGTKWQQNAGISLYQPIIDFSIKSNVAESRINERIKNADLAVAEQELESEVINSFLSVFLKEQQVRSSQLDTLGTYKTTELVKAKSAEGKTLKAEMNRALLNHNNALSTYKTSLSELIKEKIYLSFLTGFPLQSLLEGEYDFSIFSDKKIFEVPGNSLIDSIPTIRQLSLQADLVDQKERSEKRKLTPTVGFEGFLGANQYTDKFDPVHGNSWYGNSYAGLTIKLPLLSGENTGNKMHQLKLQSRGLKYRIEDEQNLITNKGFRLTEEIGNLESQISLSMQNIDLLEENLTLYQERFDKGQINAYDLFSQEIDLQKEKSKLNEQRAGLMKAYIDRIINSGNLGLFISKLK